MKEQNAILMPQVVVNNLKFCLPAAHVLKPRGEGGKDTPTHSHTYSPHPTPTFTPFLLLRKGCSSLSRTHSLM
jgi:hypothetical protein